MKFNSKLAVTGAGVALGFTTINANPTQAATVTVDFTVTVTSATGIAVPTLNNQFSGFYSYDDATIPSNVVLPTFPPKYQLTNFNFDFLGTNYSLSDFSTGAGYGGSATGLVGFLTKFAPEEEVLAGYGGIIGSGIAVKSSIGFNGEQGGFFFTNNQFNQRGDATGFVLYGTTHPVPEPSFLSSVSLAGLSLMLLKKKVASKQGG